MDPISAVLLFYVLSFGVGLLLLCGIVYAVTATIRRAWHPERLPPPLPLPPPPSPAQRRRDWITVMLILIGVFVVLGLLSMLPPA